MLLVVVIRRIRCYNLLPSQLQVAAFLRLGVDANFTHWQVAVSVLGTALRLDAAHQGVGGLVPVGQSTTDDRRLAEEFTVVFLPDLVAVVIGVLVLLVNCWPLDDHHLVWRRTIAAQETSRVVSEQARRCRALKVTIHRRLGTAPVHRGWLEVEPDGVIGCVNGSFDALVGEDERRLGVRNWRLHHPLLHRFEVVHSQLLRRQALILPPARRCVLYLAEDPCWAVGVLAVNDHLWSLPAH